MVDDPDARAHEAHVTSDIAEGWDPRSKTKQSKGSPGDADFGAVLSLTNDGLHKDPDEAVAEILQAVKQAKKETRTTIEVEAKPICEFTEFSKMLSGGFPAEFPLGVSGLTDATVTVDLIGKSGSRCPDLMPLSILLRLQACLLCNYPIFRFPLADFLLCGDSGWRGSPPAWHLSNSFFRSQHSGMPCFSALSP